MISAGPVGEAAAPHFVAHASQALDQANDRKDEATRRAPLALAPPGARRRRGGGVLYGKAPGPARASRNARPPRGRPPPGSAPLAKGEVAALRGRQAPRPAPALAFNGPDGKKLTLADFQGRAKAAQPVGDLVRALPRRDAGARPAAGGGRRQEFRSRRRQCRHRAARPAAGLSQRDRRRRASGATPIRAPTFEALRLAARRSDCRPACWSTPKAAKSASSPDRRNGIRRTRRRRSAPSKAARPAYFSTRW